jgi:hypothetical protein
MKPGDHNQDDCTCSGCVWNMKSTTPPDRLQELEQWLYVGPSQEFPTTERINLLENIAGAALEIRELRHQLHELQNSSVVTRETVGQDTP